ncbi:hypothetical protein ACE1B6_27005 [Aerosakkonemataceae cyanobacterium BLCC-F154]|uniref:Heparinase II N-terminal domain-containing protein n=1 Tax=Floridaenema fluviatile BLCC-F154 TaxID=3153640 RepID=A0ABV4YJB5_9CYAN
MKIKFIVTVVLVSLISFACAVGIPANSKLPVKQDNYLVAVQESSARNEETAFAERSLAIRQKIAAQNLDELDVWWRRENIGDPHKYLLPVILARLSLGEKYDRQHSWNILLNIDKDRSDIYHFRSIYDLPIFFYFRDKMPDNVKEYYRSMVESNRVKEWLETGTENHMMMQRLSGLALIDGSGWSNSDPATPASIEAWLRAEINKFLTIGQGEFHSSTYYGYSIGGLLNLYDFAKTPELKELAKAALDWYAANMAVRLSWGTAGGAESRGFDRGTWDETSLSAVAWMWWGDDVKVAERMRKNVTPLALLAGLSSYRPPAEFKALARKEIPLPFQLLASHPAYYSYHEDNQFWETFYITNDYSLSTLLIPGKSYQTKGTINAQYATYKLVVRDPKRENNAVISLGGTYHNLMGTGRSPGDRYLQKDGTVIYQLRLNEQDKKAGVPNRSHLVLPASFGQAKQYKSWYIWRIHEVWLCVRPWGEISLLSPISERYKDYQALVAKGDRTAWITDIARVSDYPDFQRLTAALDRSEIGDRQWESVGKLTYTSLAGNRLEMTYQPNEAISRAMINDQERILKNWSVLESPYLRQSLKSGILEMFLPGKTWRLRNTLTSPKWELISNPS